MRKSNFFLLLSTSILGLIFLELTAFVILDSKSKNSSLINYVNALVKNKVNRNPSYSNLNSQRLVSSPYVLYRNNPNYISSIQPGLKEYDKHGYRNPEYDLNKNCIKILALGGSTTNQYPYVKREHTWTMKVASKLRKTFSNNCFQIFNAGIPFGTSAELASEYLFNGKHLKPDLLIIHTGGNDGIALWQKDYNTDYSHIRSRGTINTGIMHALNIDNIFIDIGKKVISKSSILKLLVISVIKIEGGLIAYTASINGIFPLNPEYSLELTKSRPSTGFKSNIENIVAVANDQNTKVLLIPFIQAKEENLSKNNSIAIGYEKSMVEAVRKHSKILEDISNKNGHVSFFEFEKDKFRSEWFIDNCHMTKEGSYEKSNQIFEYLIKNYNFRNI